MYISRVVFENFRNFESLDLSVNRGFIVLSGPNGAGKTNFLEGLYYGSSLKRFPESSFGQLFLDGQDFFRCTLDYQDGETGSLEAFSQKTETAYKHKLAVTGQVTTRTKYPSHLQVVSFLPQDLNLLTRSPGGRRRYLDEALSLTSSEYRHALSQYQKTLRQRNDLLVQIRDNQKAAASDLDVWNEQLVGFGSFITSRRRDFLKYVNANILSTMHKLSPTVKAASFIYKNSGEADKGQYLERLIAVRNKETSLGTTVLGPHRDDFESKVSQKAAVGYVSRGELRSITLALKILEKNYTEEKLGHPPVLLLDDVFSEFDAQHQEKLVEFIREVDQVFITTAHLEGVQKFLPQDAQIFEVQAGRIEAKSKVIERVQ